MHALEMQVLKMHALEILHTLRMHALKILYTVEMLQPFKMLYALVIGLTLRSLKNCINIALLIAIVTVLRALESLGRLNIFRVGS